MELIRRYWWSSYLLHPYSLWSMVLINFLGSIYGYYWYHQQLAETNWYWWPLVPDSPFSSTLMMFSMLYLLARKDQPGLFLWGNLSAIKYGIWAAIININYWQLTNVFGWENWMLTLSHIGMALEGLLLLLILPFKKKHVLGVALWFSLNDGLDYLINLHPYLFVEAQYNLAWLSVVTLSVCLLLFSWQLSNRTED